MIRPGLRSGAARFLYWARRSRPGGRGRKRSRNVRTPQGRVLG